ncbi:uncharacterized protein LOC119904615 isoform X2 [Micropterus salmoides]|uniref:uncharacterized protein LOC119904615 isoform X2 n=1 Tax=Micropterus salmoides TaxID=27706 RepID=UPI0018EC7D1F|nr:uncharacterized protein LOC119904615 isoform X2 [Micropterus salmoides]
MGDYQLGRPADHTGIDQHHETVAVGDNNTISYNDENTDSSDDEEASDEDLMAEHLSSGPSDEGRIHCMKWNRFFFGHAVIVPLRTDKLNSLVFGLTVTFGALLLQHVEGGTDASDESADEDVMEHVLDPNFNDEKKIYAGSSVTMGALLLLLLAFILKHGLSKAATKDLLELLNFVVPGCVPKSVWFLKQHFLDYNDKTELHFYCPSCSNYLGVEPANKCGVCQQKGLLEKAYYFLVMPLKVQLRNTLAHVQSKLRKHFTRDACVSDINTGTEYRRETQGVHTDRITLTFKGDGSPVFNSSKTSIWPILCTINELPFVDRCKNVLLHTLWFGKGKPQVQSYFTPFIRELQKLGDTGFRWKDETGSEHHTKVTAKICICDAVARAMVQNFKQFNGEFGCGFCYHKGEMVQKGRGFTRVYPEQIVGCDLRHMAETVQLAELVVENGNDQSQRAVKGPSPLILLPSFDIIKGFIPDYMHCFCLGVLCQFVNLWFDPHYANKNFHLTPRQLNELDKGLCKIQPPNEIRRNPRRLSERIY